MAEYEQVEKGALKLKVSSTRVSKKYVKFCFSLFNFNEHIYHEVKKSSFGYIHLRFNLRLHQCCVLKILHPHFFSRLS